MNESRFERFKSKLFIEPEKQNNQFDAFIRNFCVKPLFVILYQNCIL